MKQKKTTLSLLLIPTILCSCGSADNGPTVRAYIQSHDNASINLGVLGVITPKSTSEEGKTTVSYGGLLLDGEEGFKAVYNRVVTLQSGEVRTYDVSCPFVWGAFKDAPFQWSISYDLPSDGEDMLLSGTASIGKYGFGGVVSQISATLVAKTPFDVSDSVVSTAKTMAEALVETAVAYANGVVNDAAGSFANLW